MELIRRLQNSNHSIGSLIAASKREDNDSRYGRDSTYNIAPSVNYGANGEGTSPRRSLAFDRQSQFGQRSVNGGSQYQPSNYGGTQYGNNGEQSPGSNSGFFNNGTHERTGSNLAMQEEYNASRPVSMAFTNNRNSRAMSPGPRNFGQLPPDHVIINDIQMSSSSPSSAPPSQLMSRDDSSRFGQSTNIDEERRSTRVGVDVRLTARGEEDDGQLDYRGGAWVELRRGGVFLDGLGLHFGHFRFCFSLTSTYTLSIVVVAFSSAHFHSVV